MTTLKGQIIITAVVSIAIIVAASVYNFTPNDKQEFMKKNHHNIQRMNITITNQNNPGSGKWIELRCKGYLDNDPSDIWWSGVALVEPGRKHNLTLPTVSLLDIIHVYCKYNGSDGCMANKLLLFESPGTDNYFCGEGVGRCVYSFKSDGLVEKEYVGMLNRSLGYVPTTSAEERKCLWIDCLLNFIGRIGKKHCCGSGCEGWQ